MARREPWIAVVLAAVSVTILGGVTAVRSALGADEQPPAVIPLDPADQAISQQVQKRLYVDPNVPSSEVQIETTAGIVTLRGTVRSLVAKARAERIAQSTPGVVSVINDLQVSHSPVPSDPDIGRDIRYALGNTDLLKFKNVRVQVDSGAVRLSGTVNSPTLRNQATRIAQRVPGVASVENDLHVTSAGIVSDADIQDAIVEAFRRDGLLNPASMRVEVRGGRVQFSGTVASAAERVRAVQAAWAAGASSVDASGLALAAPHPAVAASQMVPSAPYDGRIRAAVEAALAEDGRVDALPIHIEVARQIVTLRGAVGNPAAKKLAGDVAQQVDGVLEVVNQLRVEPSQRHMDEMIRDRMLGLVRSDPRLRMARIDAAVVNGVVRLSGIVDSPADRRLTDRLGLRIPGVVAIENELLMRHPEVTERPVPIPPIR